jgi:hypothetical protein
MEGDGDSKDGAAPKKGGVYPNVPFSAVSCG